MFRQFERLLVAVVGTALAGLGFVILQLELLSEPARVVLGWPFVVVGVLTAALAFGNWKPHVGSASRRDTPELLLPVERLFLVPLVALEVAGLAAVVRDPDLHPAVQLALGLSTVIVLLITGGLVLDLIHLPSLDPGRDRDAPSFLRGRTSRGAPRPPARSPRSPRDG